MSTCMSRCHLHRQCIFQVAHAEEIPSRKAEQGVQEINFADKRAFGQLGDGINPPPLIPCTKSHEAPISATQ